MKSIAVFAAIVISVSIWVTPGIARADMTDPDIINVDITVPIYVIGQDSNLLETYKAQCRANGGTIIYNENGTKMACDLSVQYDHVGAEAPSSVMRSWNLDGSALPD